MPSKMKEFKCEFCNINPSTSWSTKCCKNFICQLCKQQLQNKMNCICGNKIINKKICTQDQFIYNLIKNNKQQQCQRCLEEIAILLCQQCVLYLCESCYNQLHQNAKRGFRNHQAPTNLNKFQLFQEQIIQNSQIIKKNINICLQHKQSIEYVCQCTQFFCSNCIKTQKQKCQKPNCRLKNINEYQQDYCNQILHKFKQITQFKQDLNQNKKVFKQNFTKQQQIFKNAKESINNQFQTLKNILQLKHQQFQSKINDYWNDCVKIYQQNLFFIDFQLKKYDEYSKLTIKFTQNQVGLDYLQKKIKKISINNQFFNLRLSNTDQIKDKMIDLTIYKKDWEKLTHLNIIFPVILSQAQEKRLTKRAQIVKNCLLQNKQSLILYNKNPKMPRPLFFNCSHNQIEFNFFHLPHQNQIYQIQYGVGFRMKGTQIFKKILNQNGKGIIKCLNPSTKYRIRMKVLQNGEYGQIYEVSSLEIPKIIFEPNNICKLTGEYSFQFLKQGVVYSNNPLTFGTHYLIIILNAQKSSYDDSQTACMSIGISNKQQKKNTFIGSTFNYGYQREQITIRIKIDCEEQVMVILSGNTKQKQQKYSSFPNFPIFPTIHNKSNATVHIRYSFNQQEY